MKNRGRPANKMTQRRQQILERYQASAQSGEHISLARMARECGISDYRNARRTLKDLKRIGALA